MSKVKKSISYQLKLVSDKFVIEESLPLIEKFIKGTPNLQSDIESDLKDLQNYLIILPEDRSQFDKIISYIFEMIKLKQKIPSHISKTRDEEAQKEMKSFIDKFKSLIIEKFNPEINQIFKDYSINDIKNRKVLIIENLNRIFALNKQMMNVPDNFPKIPIL